MRKGFTLIEVIVAIFIMVMGAVGVFGLITRTVVFSSSVNSQLVASYLAQEGLEIMRNMRDTNFLKIHKGAGGIWTDGIIACASPYGCTVELQADYTQTFMDAYNDADFLRINGSFYGYAPGNDTTFKRKITIIQSSADVLKVAVDVSWQDKGNARTVRGATELYNWLSPTP